MNKDSATSRESPSPERPLSWRTIWKKPIAWIITTAIAAFGLAFSGWLQQAFTSLIVQSTEIGDPVVASYTVESAVEDVYFPEPASFADSDLASLSALKTADQSAWLEARGGTILGQKTVNVHLEGNRTKTTRITNVEALATCERPRDGTLVRLASGRGATQDSIRMGIDISETPAAAWWLDPESGIKRPYFPGKTITLTKGETEFLVIDLHPTRDFCSVTIEMEVSVGSDRFRQTVVPPNQEITIMPLVPHADEANFGNVYLGGDICTNYVPAPHGWFFLEDSGCGSGNTAF